VTFCGTKIAARPAEMQAAPSILAPGAQHSIPVGQILTIATQMTKNRVASIPLVLFLKNERAEDYVCPLRLGQWVAIPAVCDARAAHLTESRAWSQKKK